MKFSCNINISLFAVSLLAVIPYLALNLPADMETATIILHDLRLPRVAVGYLCGGTLALAGLMSQRLFRNPLATPSVIGIEATAALGVVISAYFFGTLTHLSLTAACLMGAATATLILLVMTRHYERARSFVVFGFSLNALTGALASLILIKLVETPQLSAQAQAFVMGSLIGRGWGHAFFILLALLLIAFHILRDSKKLELIAESPEVAFAYGVQEKKLLRSKILVLCCVVSITVICGAPLPFVGFVAPQIIAAIKPAIVGRQVLATFLCGGALVVCSDLIAREIFFPRELETGIVTALVGSFILVVTLARGGLGERSL